MSDLPWHIILMVCFGFLAGFINTVAGGGSLLILPLYLSLGIPPSLANYANRIPIFAQSGMATISYAVAKKLKWKKVIPYLIPILSGAAVGAFLAIDINARLINRVLLGVLIFVGITLISDMFEKNERRKQYLKKIFVRKPSYWVTVPVLCVVGFYGGFIQVGVGLIIYPIMHILFKEHYLTANIIKVVTLACMCALSLVIFYSRLTPELLYLGLITAGGGVLGSVLGVRVTIGKHGEKIIRILLIMVSVAGILRLIFIV